MLRSIEARLGTPIAQLGAGYSLPPELARNGDNADTTVYGQSAGGEDKMGAKDRDRLAAHVLSLAPTVRELGSLEFEAQNIWLAMSQGRF